MDKTELKRAYTTEIQRLTSMLARLDTEIAVLIEEGYSDEVLSNMAVRNRLLAQREETIVLLKGC